MKLAMVVKDYNLNERILRYYTKGVGSVEWPDGRTVTMPPMPMVSHGNARLIPVETETINNSTGSEFGTKVSSETLEIQPNRVLKTITLVDAEQPNTTSIHKVWLKIYLSNKGFLETLENLINQVGGETKLLWDDGTEYSINDLRVHQMWEELQKLIPAAEDITLQEVFNESEKFKNNEPKIV